MKQQNQSKKYSNKPKQQPQKQPKSVRDNPSEESERIQKVLARGGMGSRREIERWIEEGRFKLNSRLVKLGERLKHGDHLTLNGRVVHWEKYTEQHPRVLVYHKPVGEVVTRRDPEGRPVIFTQLPKMVNGRWIAVGRLDINTQGLIMVTNNGELANRLMHPSTQIDREYAVRVLGEISDETLERLKQGVELEDGFAKFHDIRFSGGEGANKWYHVTVMEGRNRLVRRLWESQQITVSRLMRVRYGPVMLPPKLKSHTFYELNSQELKTLFEYAGMEMKSPDTGSPKEKNSRPGSKNRRK